MSLVRSFSSISDNLQSDAKSAVNDSELLKTRAIARLCTCTCALLPLAFSVVFCGLYWRMWNQALQFNSDVSSLEGGEQQVSEVHKGDINFYDSCGLGVTEPVTDTKWIIVLGFNAILYLSMSCFTLIVCLGTYYLPLVIFGGCGHCIGIIA